MTLRKFGFAGLVAATAWLLVPCARAQISDNTVKIGVLADMSGLYSDLSGIGSVVATQMAVEDFGRTLPGKKIEVVSADHQNKPDIGANVARQWIDQHGVFHDWHGAQSLPRIVRAAEENHRRQDDAEHQPDLLRLDGGAKKQSQRGERSGSEYRDEQYCAEMSEAQVRNRPHDQSRHRQYE